METKRICKQCGIEKPIDQFHKSSVHRGGHKPICAECYNWNHRTEKDKETEQTKWRLLAMGLKYCPCCKTIKGVSYFSFQKSRKDSYRAYCKECDRTRNLDYSRTEQGLSVRAKYMASERYFQKLRDRYHKKRETKPDYVLEASIRSSLNTAVKRCGVGTKEHYVNLVGCSNFKLHAHIQGQFTEGMDWNNHTRRGWHVDHILPMNAFDLNNPIHYMACCNWRNLQPMWARPNIQKGCKYNKDDFDAYIKLFI
jgi:hypothetical protein